MTVLADTSFLPALSFSRDHNHEKARSFSETSTELQIIPTPVLFELFYMVTVRTQYANAVVMLDQLRNSEPDSVQVTPLLSEDYQRMIAIMRQYRDAEFDFADVAIMALTERLKITRILTFDRRDFSIYRPQRVDYLELLP